MKYFSLHATFTNCVGFPTLERGQWPMPPFSHSREHWKNSLHRLTSRFSGPEHPSPRVWVKREKRRDFMRFSLQLFRRYKQHLANSVPKWLQMLWAAGAHPLSAALYLHRIYTSPLLKRPHVSDREHFHSCCIRQRDSNHCSLRADLRLEISATLRW